MYPFLIGSSYERFTFLNKDKRKLSKRIFRTNGVFVKIEKEKDNGDVVCFYRDGKKLTRKDEETKNYY